MLSDDDLITIITEDRVDELRDFVTFFDDVDFSFPKPKEPPHPEIYFGCNYPSLLCAAAMYRSYNCVDLLISCGADINYRDRKYRTPILYAIIGGSVQIVQILLENGAELNVTDAEGNGVIHYTVNYRKKPLLVWFYFAYCADISLKNKRKVTPLHIASTNMLTDYIEFLCDNGADINAKTDRGATPLHYASAKKSLENVEILAKYGADLSLKDNGGLQPYHWAGSLNHKDIQEFLVDHGAAVRDF